MYFGHVSSFLLRLVAEYGKEGGVMTWWQKLVDDFMSNFVVDNRWKFLVDGLAVTLKVTALAVVVGLLLGFLVAVVRTVHEETGRFKILNAIAGAYLTFFRGTPVVVQLMLIYFVVLGQWLGVTNKLLAAVLAFGINSGAYQAEIFRAGIQSIPRGQFEAGRSLGFSYAQTMVTIIMPQALKNILPTLCNEFITLLKETSVAGYIALQDLTKGGDIIRSRTYSAFMPLIAVALIYLVMVLVLTNLIRRLERRLKRSER
jgi:His/Glu/Gln/Arg/opine family amino acid ABC transporter permease subunit